MAVKVWVTSGMTSWTRAEACLISAQAQASVTTGWRRDKRPLATKPGNCALAHLHSNGRLSRINASAQSEDNDVLQMSQGRAQATISDAGASEVMHARWDGYELRAFSRTRPIVSTSFHGRL